MMLFKSISRCLYTSKTCLVVEKSLLAKLRKKTGYTFSHCKKALEIHNNDMSKAETWLKHQAQQLGWAKATKLQGRQTRQGLIAVSVKNNSGAIVELNCETDFVARNDKFQTMAQTATAAILKYVEKQKLNSPLTKIGLDADQLKQISATDGQTLGDHVAVMIGILGENASLRRALCLRADSAIHISCYAHPSGLLKNNVLLGRFGGLVALRQTTKKDVDLEAIGKNLCQHIVGMDPKKIGSDTDQKAANPDDETCLIHQEYLLDDTLLISDILSMNGVEVVDFKRFACGETAYASEQPLDFVETCQ